MQPFQQRVIDEQQQLSDMLTKLREFFETATFDGLPEAEQMRLIAQADFMEGYETMLLARIEAFSPA